MPPRSSDHYSPERLTEIANTCIRAAKDLKDLAASLKLNEIPEMKLRLASALNKAEAGLPKFILAAKQDIRDAVSAKNKKKAEAIEESEQPKKSKPKPRK